ncbi:MAG TPA: tRNA modification GTPase [Pirellulales bacterium]|nr:tRNA modification GTPase [Pirellulales bacterium]
MFDLNETIAAIASPPGGAARGIVRISGPGALTAVVRLFSPDGPTDLGEIRRPTALDGRLRLVRVEAPVPCRLYLWPSSRSYTRQPTAELHTLGSPPLLAQVLDELCAAGARPARPGEFTLRAFLAGRLDLTQAEAVLGVIDARGPEQLSTALAQLAGGLATPLARLRDELLDLLAHLEAGLDFAEEEIEFISADQLVRQLQAALTVVAQLAEQMESRAETSEVVRVVLVGAPNVGKTSLYNALAGQAALVSPRAGTTRDYLRARLDLGGVACELVDTAGIGSPSPAAMPAVEVGARDLIDLLAQRAAADEREQADIEILCLDATRPLNAWERSAAGESSSRQRIVVLNKIDQRLAHPRNDRGFDLAQTEAIETSSVTGAGLDRLRQRLRALACAVGRDGGQAVASTAARCRESLRQAAAALNRAGELAAARRGEELVAAEVRLALDGLGQIIGAIYTEDVLDRIFSRFCIGK